MKTQNHSPLLDIFFLCNLSGMLLVSSFTNKQSDPILTEHE